MDFPDKDTARRFFHKLTQLTKDWNRIPFGTEEFKKLETQLLSLASEAKKNV
jgi:V/A-type H+-transporting ATPase subunit A